MKTQESEIDGEELEALKIFERGSGFESPAREKGSPVRRWMRAFHFDDARSGRVRAGVILLCIFVLYSANDFWASGQSYSIDWFKVSGGGGTSTGGVYSVSGTIGQHDANSQPMIGGNYSLTGGFWSLLSVVQTPGAPALTITLTSTNTALISWPSPSSGFKLQQNSSLGSTNWIVPPETVTDNGAKKFIIVNPPVGNHFYRLIKP